MKSENEKLLDEQAGKRKALADKLRDKDLTAFRAINKLYKKQLAEIEKLEEREREQLEKEQTSQKLKDEFDRSTGKDEDRFDDEYGRDEPFFGDRERGIDDDDSFSGPPHDSGRKPPKGPDRGR